MFHVIYQYLDICESSICFDTTHELYDVVFHCDTQWHIKHHSDPTNISGSWWNSWQFLYQKSMVILWGLRVTKPLVVSSLKALCNNEAFFNHSALWGSGFSSSSQHVFLHFYLREISHLLATQTQTPPFFIQPHRKWRLKSQYLPEAVPKVSKKNMKIEHYIWLICWWKMLGM